MHGQDRAFRDEISERLAEQALHALYELLRGFQVAHDASGGSLLREPLGERPDEVYRALVTVILRLVFVLYAEDRGLFPDDATFGCSLAGLYERLREEAVTDPGAMDERHAAWAQLLGSFRAILDGFLFDPQRFPFLEGFGEPPCVPDGTVHRVLEKLLVVGGERVSYRTLDVEQIGSIHEALMGFRLEVTTGASVAIKAPARRGAATVVNLDDLLAEHVSKRAGWIQDRSRRKVPARLAAELASARSLEDLHAALGSWIDRSATPAPVPAGVMVLEPSGQRRRSGSHYTPRAVTEPIVRSTLAPALERLSTADEILELKVCDPAMGSGAFLVEACRQLADALTEAWHVHGSRPEIPADEDEVLFARRLVAGRCLYGVDSNPIAVDLAKVSLWLVTLARDHALTFVDHALRLGDSLVGLSRKQIEALRCDEEGFDLDHARMVGDLVLAAFFDARGPEHRAVRREEFAAAVRNGEVEPYRDWIREWRAMDPSLVPFHWEIEFPEVFEGTEPGFDAVIGNPPYIAFYGRGSQAAHFRPGYKDYLEARHAEVDGRTALSGRINTFVSFCVLASGLLRASGNAAFVLPDAVLTNESYEPLRAAMTRSGRLCAVQRFRSSVFDDATVGTAIVHWGGSGHSKPVRLQDWEAPSAAEPIVDTTETHADLARRQGVSWFPISGAEMRRATLPSTGTVMLGEIASLHDGINTGSKRTRAKLLCQLDDGDRSLRPCMEGKWITPFRIHDQALMVRYDPDVLDAADRKEGASLGRREVFDSPKIVYRQTAAYVIAAVDTLGRCYRNSVHAIVFKPYNEAVAWAVCCYLNSRFFRGYYQAITGETRRTFPQVHLSSMRRMRVPLTLLDSENADTKALAELGPLASRPGDNRSVLAGIDALVDRVVAQAQRV